MIIMKEISGYSFAWLKKNDHTDNKQKKIQNSVLIKELSQVPL